jgi:adenosine deaminase
VREHGLGYDDLKQVSRAGLEYGFLSGASLWAAGRLGTPAKACQSSYQSSACAALIAGSEKARLQFALETQFERYERTLAEFSGGKGA